MNKSIFKSLTAWGGLIAVIPTILRVFGIDISDAEVSQAANHAGVITESGTQLVGLVMVIWGRIRAGGVSFMGG